MAQNGLLFGAYSGYHNDNPAYFDGKSPWASGYTVNLGSTGSSTNNNFGANSRDSFSIRWVGFFRASVSGSYVFYMWGDDGCFFWLGSNAISGFASGNQQIYNNWYNGEISATLSLDAGTYYPVRIMYGDSSGPDGFTFSFTVPGNSNRVYDGTGFYYPCAPGYYCSSFAITACPVNTYNALATSTASSDCLGCPTGRFSTITGASICASCAAGAYLSGGGCVNCAAGECI
jgi:hypothetical protein